MNVLVTLNPGLGAQLGPNFNLTADVGIVYPSTATLAELLSGFLVTVLDSAQIITVTSIGECTNSIELVINHCSTTTSTTSTTTSTTSTTTTTTLECAQFELVGFNGGGTWSAITCFGQSISGGIPPLETVFTGCIISNSLVVNNAGISLEIGCNETTTSTTTTTTLEPTYDYCLGYDEFEPYYACQDYAGCITTTSTTIPNYDILSGSFTVVNDSDSLSDINVDLGGYGTNSSVTLGESKVFDVSGNINFANAAIFTIGTSGGVNNLNVVLDTLSCTGVLDVQIFGNGTPLLYIYVVPATYDGSTDVISGTLSIIVT